MSITLRSTLNHWAFASLVPALLGLAIVQLSAEFGGLYGWTLFFGAPLMVGFLSAFFFSFQNPRPYLGAFLISQFSLLLVTVLILVCGFDGFICLLVVLPLAWPAGALGSILGSWLGARVGARQGVTLSALWLVLLPMLVGFEQALTAPPSVREVRSSIEIQAPIEVVWDNVVAFTQITEPPSWIFRMGIAYPIEARIEGQGVGAVRHCVFSTGSFVEPITAWERPHRLAFDVSAMPPPMHEITPYQHIDPPHLEGYLVSKQGEFRLTQVGDKVLLEGSTWYTHRITPEFYWSLISDEIIHRIHLRVLEHIRLRSESASR